MFYVELFKIVIVGVTYIIIVNLLIYKILTEYDKTIKVKEYKKNGGFFSKVSGFIFSCVYPIIYLIFPLLIVFYIAEGNNVIAKKRREMWFKQIFGQIIVICALLLSSAGIFYLYIYYYNLSLFYPFFYFFIGFIAIVDLIFFLTLWIKQLVNLYKVEKKSFSYLTRTYGDISKKEKYHRLAKEYKYKKDKLDLSYCKIYDSEYEWKEAVDTKKTYGFLYKAIQLYSPIWVILINILFASFYWDILPQSFIFDTRTNYDLIFPFFSGYQTYDLYYVSGILIGGSILIYLQLTYILNADVLVKGSLKKKQLKDVKFSQRMLTVILVVLLALSGYVYYVIYGDLQNTEPLVDKGEYYVSFDEHKSNVVDAIHHLKEYDNYSFEEKIMYITRNHKKLNDTLNSEGYQKLINSKYKEYVFYNQSSEENIDEYQKNAYTCNVGGCEIGIQIENSKFQFISINKWDASIYYDDLEKEPIIFGVTPYPKSITCQEVLQPYISERLSSYLETLKNEDKMMILKDIYNKVIALKSREEHYEYNPANDTKIIQYYNERIEAYNIILQEVDKIFDEMTS